jgi:hypothetical protein
MVKFDLRVHHAAGACLGRREHARGEDVAAGWFGKRGKEVAAVLVARAIVLHTLPQNRGRLVLPAGAAALAMTTAYISVLSLLM